MALTDVSITGTTTVTSSGYGLMHICSGTTSNYAVTLPTAVSAPAGTLIGFRMSSALTKLVTLTSSTGTQMDGAATRIMWANESCILESDGAQWRKIAGKSLSMTAKLDQATPQAVATTTIVAMLLDSSDSARTNVTAMCDTSGHRITILRPSRYEVTVFNTFTSATGSNARVLCYVGLDPAVGSYTDYDQSETFISTGGVGGGWVHMSAFNMVINTQIQAHVLHTASGSESMAGRLSVVEVPNW